MEISEKLKENLNYIKKNFNFQQLKRENLGVDFNFNEAANNLEKVHNYLVGITSNSKILKVSNETENNIAEIARLFKLIIDRIESFRAKDNINASNEHKNIHEEAASLYQRSLNILEPLTDKIVVAKLKSNEFEVLSDTYLEEIKKAKKLSEEFLSNQDKFLNATKIAENWIKVKNKALDISVEEKSQYFENKAGEHEGEEINWWFKGAIISGIVALIIVICFIIKLNGDISVGAALLRISAIIFPSYFAIFCSQQFLNHNKLYEAYKFKSIALKTMRELLKEYTGEVEKLKILSRGINIIFQEPTLKDNSMIQKEIINDLKDILKGKIN